MVRERPYGLCKSEIKRGSVHFAPGAKLYCKQRMGWKPHPQIMVVGRHRGSHRYVTMIVSASWLTSWRVELAYSPHVVRELWPLWDGAPESKAKAEWLIETYGAHGKHAEG